LSQVGRRHLRSNNSWMHNLPHLARGRDLCTLHVHPDDAARLGLADGGAAPLTSRAGEVRVAVELTNAIMPGVVSLPHGFGHDEAGVQLTVAAARPRGEQQPPRRRAPARPAIRQRRAERHPARPPLSQKSLDQESLARSSRREGINTLPQAPLLDGQLER
jgi:predicted molibdopterin-dependent oxidoreductase YjgC